MDDDELGDLTHVAPAYKRALWTVMALNLAYGSVEIGGGFLAGSQGLKADALDFLAAALVWLTATSWPDLIVAAAIAGLFLQSAWMIIQGAHRELAEARSTST